MPDPTPLPSDPFSPFVPSAETPFDHRRLCHLLRRAALGVSLPRLQAYAGQSPSQVIDSLTAYDPADDRPYAERQSHPADFDAQSSQRTIAVHALEHLGSADRGVIMLRRIVRDGIRAVARGTDPFGSRRPEGKVIRTFTQDVVFRVPPAPSPEADRRLLRATGRSVLNGGS